MATSLQQQLAKIAATSTHQLDLKAQKAAHGKSLLFEEKVASSQDFNTLYRICLEGFEELCALDPRYKTFSKSIFSEQSRSEERGMMTAAENKELDGVLESFLTLVAGRLLLRPAQKAVEWVIRRFRVHELNTEYLLLSFLPYHSTPLFSSLLTILPKQLPQSFRFLYPSIGSLQDPTFHTIVYTAINNSAFFSAFNNFILRACRSRYHAPAIMSFWASLTTQAVDGMLSASQSGRRQIQKQKQEDLFLRILPLLNEALSVALSDVAELGISACMIITVLGAKGNLDDSILDSLMEAIAVNFTRSTTDARLTCLAMLAEQRSVVELSPRVTRRLLKFDSFAQDILSVASRTPTGRLVLGLILRIMQEAHKKQFQMSPEDVVKLLAGNTLSTEQFQALLEKCLGLIVDSTGSMSMAEPQRTLMKEVFDFASEIPELQVCLLKAIESSGVDQIRVELALQATLSVPLQISNTGLGSDQDTEMLDTSTADSQGDHALAQLKKSDLASPSFLSLSASQDYALYVAAYLQALVSEEHLKRFLQLPAFQAHDTSLGISVTTFLVRLANDQSANQLARTTALRSIQRLLRQESKPSIPTQFVLPYLISSLTDRSSGIRQAAAEAVFSLAEYLNEKTRSTASSQLFAQEIYPWTPLPNSSFKIFVERALLPHLEAAILDPENLINSVSQALDTDKSFPEDIASLICSFLAAHGAGTSLLLPKICLLSIVNSVGKHASRARRDILVPLLDSSLTASLPELNISKRETASQVLLVTELFRTISADEHATLSILDSIVSGQRKQLRAELIRPAFQRLTEIWDQLPSERSNDYAKILVEAALQVPTSQEFDLYHEVASETIRQVILPSQTLKALLSDLPNVVHMPNNAPAKKRRRTSKSEIARSAVLNSEDVAAALAKYTLALELVENSRPQEHPELLRGLFDVLEELQQYRLHTQSGLVYLQGLTIACLLAIIDKFKDNGKDLSDASSIRADLIVDCIRHSSNSQVQSSALLLISSLASWQPETVVHSIMPIFTFMGNVILRQGDDYSAHVTEKTLSQVIPPLVESFRSKNTDIMRGTANLLLSFTAAFEHIPSQRRLSLFEHLVRTVGPDESLFATLAMLIDGYPTDARVKKFVAELVNQFEPSTNLKTIRQSLNLVGDMFRQRPTTAQHVLNLSERSKDTYDNIANNLLVSLARLLEDKELRRHMSKSFQSENIDKANAQRSACVDLIQEAIRLSHFLRSKPLLAHSTGAVLSNIVNLLPTAELVQCAGTLLAQKDDEVRLVAVRSVNSRVQDITSSGNDDIAALLNFVPQLSSVLHTSPSTTLISNTIACIGQIIKKFGKKNTAVAVSAAQVIAGELALKHTDSQVQLTAVECLIIHIELLKDEFIPLVPQVLPTIFQYFKQCLEQTSESGIVVALSLARSCFHAVSAFVHHLPYLMTGDYLDSILLLAASAAGSEIYGPKTKDLRTTLFRAIAKDVGANEAFTALTRNLDAVVAAGQFDGLIEYFAAVKLVLNLRSKSAIIRNSSALFDLFIQAFDHRRLATVAGLPISEIEEEDLLRLQSIYNDVALTMVMKLNDATFRPFIVKLSEWATNLPKKDHEGSILRATSLFSFLTLLFSRLKSLVTSYATYVLDLATEILVHISPTVPVEEQVLLATVSALQESFTHDDEQFWQSPHHFNPVALPLVALLQTSSLASADSVALKARASIVSLAASTSSNDQHKSLNTALLKLLRHEEAGVRLIAVQTERELSEKLGEEWLGMLPAMMPLIAEVLEDEDRAVERAGKEWVRYLEGVLGESLEF